jgi:hypothetical protein
MMSESTLAVLEADLLRRELDGLERQLHDLPGAAMSWHESMPVWAKFSGFQLKADRIINDAAQAVADARRLSGVVKRDFIRERLAELGDRLRAEQRKVQEAEERRKQPRPDLPDETDESRRACAAGRRTSAAAGRRPATTSGTPPAQTGGLTRTKCNKATPKKGRVDTHQMH